MTGTYRSYSGRGRSAAKARRRTSEHHAAPAARARRAKRMETRLIACLLIAAMFSLARLVFPAAFAAVRDDLRGYINNSVDLKSAAYVIGEAINGEKSASEAFSEACGYAFGLDRSGEADAASAPEPDSDERSV